MTKHMYRHRRRVYAYSPWPIGWEGFFFGDDPIDQQDLEFDPDTVFAENRHEDDDEQEVPHIPEDW